MDSITTVGVIMRRGNKFLIAKNARGPAANKWIRFGGHVEKGEGILDAAKREFFEETGLKAKIIAPALFASYVERRHGKRFALNRFEFLGEAEGIPKIRRDEIADFKWMTIEEMKKMRKWHSGRDGTYTSREGMDVHTLKACKNIMAGQVLRIEC